MPIIKKAQCNLCKSEDAVIEIQSIFGTNYLIPKYWITVNGESYCSKLCAKQAIAMLEAPDHSMNAITLSDEDYKELLGE